ncbi:MAG: sulfatase-like hydrolase/transferase [Verrucomicrobiales bacterium]|nr:sulfatase-like hydrolase/transferase [Verrucomicrobiales bacterium]
MARTLGPTLHSILRLGLALGLLLVPSASASAIAPAARPNFLVLLADDQRADTIHAWGNRHIDTPHLDRLAHQGFSFRGNYCFGSNSGAVCIPSRAMLMSGRSWFSLRSDLGGSLLLPELLGRHGYTTFATGKWHNERASFQRAFQQGRAVFFGGMADHTQTPITDWDGTSFSPQRVASRFSSETFADAALEFLNRPASPQPFFCYVAFTAPHDPRNPPEPYRQRYYRHRPPLPRNFLPQHPFDQGWTRGLRDENLAPYPRTPEVIRDQLAEYYGLITHLDEQIGRILNALERSPHATNTYVVFAADSGLAVGSHGLLGKQSVYEHSMRAPLILAGPGIPRDRSTQAFTYLLDLFPTLTDLAGLDAPPNLDGTSLRPLWTGERRAVRDSVFLPFTDTMRAVRDERWKLIVYPQINHRQLFDLRRDPNEQRDLANDPARAETLERLTSLMAEWQSRFGDRQPLSVDHPKLKALDLHGYQRQPDAWQPAWIVKKYFQP